MAAKTILITGASSGIGRACALHLAARGWHVFAGVRRQEDGLAVVKAAKGAALTPVLLDVTDPRQIEAAVASVDAATGEQGLGALVNNAAIGTAGPLETLEISTLRQHFEVNVFGVVAVTQAFTAALRRGRGRIINISSVAGTLSGPYWGAYTASKAALESITNTMRQELWPWGIHVISLQLAPVKTPTWDKAERALDGAKAERSARDEALYGEAMVCRGTMDRKISEAAGSVDGVVRAVERALTAKRPKTRQPVGKGARSALLASWLMPDRALDSMMIKALGVGKAEG